MGWLLVATPDKKYRFSLQWSNETFEKEQVGELIKRLGHRKSEFIVMAVSTYLNEHPEVLEDFQKLQVIIRKNVPKKQIELMIRSIIAEKMAGDEIVCTKKMIATDKSLNLSEAEVRDIDVDKMLDNLDLFL